MRIAIPGATGFLGRYLVRQLAGSGEAPGEGTEEGLPEVPQPLI
jgi:hypothetical protein